MKTIKSNHEIFIYYNEKIEETFISLHEYNDIGYPLIGKKRIDVSINLDDAVKQLQVDSLESQRNRLIDEHVNNMDLIDVKMMELLSGA